MEHDLFSRSAPNEDDGLRRTDEPADATAEFVGEPEREPGCHALEALRAAENDALLAVMLRPSFKPVGVKDLVVVAPCLHCRDGGLRTAGSVRTRTGRESVRACDTCHTVEVGPLGHAQVVRLPNTHPSA